MIKNYLKTAFNGLLKNRGYSLLNIAGLAVGIACAAFIFLWVENEVNFDSFNQKKDRLYIARINQLFDTHVFTTSSTPGLYGPAIKAEIPGIANTCRMPQLPTSLLFAVDDKAIYTQGKYADPSIFSMFSLTFSQGNAANAFTHVHSLVITEKTRKKFFGDEKNVVGKSIRVDHKQDYIVSGVLKDLPVNSTLQFDWLMPFQVYFDQSPWLKDWGSNSINTYVELKPGINPQYVDKQLSDYLATHRSSDKSHVFLFSMKDWHLYDQFADGRKTGGGKIEFVHLFVIIAWIILLIACINFMNLATARSEKRAKEVGVRKVLGAGKKALIVQFIGEALLLSFFSSIIALALIFCALPLFNTLVQARLSMGMSNPYHILFLLLITVICGLVAGSYPAFYLSSFNPVSVLKGIKLKGSSATAIRKGLVIMQFTISIILIICTIIILQQLEHIKKRQLGFNKDNLIELDVNGQIATNFNAIKQDLLNTGMVENSALADNSVIMGGDNTSGFTWSGKPLDSKVLVSTRGITPEFMATSGIKILEGRNFTIQDTTGQTNILITQSMEKLMGKGSAVGKIVRDEGSKLSFTVVGVVNDYVYGNMYNQSDPVIFSCIPLKSATLMSISIKPTENMEKALSVIGTVLKRDNPGYPFDYRFVDDQFNRFFETELLVSKLSRLFASLAILISCLGLFGLTAYTAERRIKEIGVRKVLGASVPGITALLSKDFLKLLFISWVLAFPLAYWEMTNWLNKYAYHVSIHWWVFIIAGIMTAFIALITVSFQSVKAALANPVKSLRIE